MWSIVLGSILTSAQAAPTDYALMANKGILYINVYKDTETLGAALAHDHAIQAVGWSGKATWDPDDVSACNISVTVPVSFVTPVAVIEPVVALSREEISVAATVPESVTTIVSSPRPPIAPAELLGE